jgi:damage-control phosphatase, subfamily I
MEVTPHCRECLKELAHHVVELSGGDSALLNSCIVLIDNLFRPSVTPTAISNMLLKTVRKVTGVEDPFSERKANEFRAAMRAADRLKNFFPDTFEGVLMSSAFGNGGDFFLDHAYDISGFRFSGEIAKVEHAVYISNRVLIIGDNVGDFVFDLPLVGFLRGRGKEVLYAVKERPVQNDISLADIARFGADTCPEVVSSGTDEVGIRKEEMSAMIRECWEGKTAIIAKGMGNFETISEFDHERPIIYVMRVKCQSVAEALSREIGDYIAITGGDYGR